MVRYIIRRLLWVVVLLFFVSFLTFIIFYTLPSADPALLRAGRQPNPELVEQIRHNLGLDQPWYQQYFDYMKQLVLHFDLGYSFQNNYPVKDQIFNRLPASISVAIGAAVIWLLLGISIGVISAVRSRTALDRVTMGLALVAISAPVYWLGLVALYLFSNDIGRFHVFMGAGTYVPFSQDPWLWFGSLIMPWFVLAAAFAAFYARLVRGSMIETMSEDYIRTARAKGLVERRIVVRHALKNALVPIVTVIGVQAGYLLGGAVLTETVFAWPGVGTLMVQGILARDIPLVQGCVLVVALTFVLVNLFVDLLYAWLDPRIRYE